MIFRTTLFRGAHDETELPVEVCATFGHAPFGHATEVEVQAWDANHKEITLTAQERDELAAMALRNLEYV